MKKVKKIITSEKKNLGPKQFVMSPLPNQWVAQISPFIMLDHFGPNHIPAREPFFVPPHPHRGFAPVTILFEGEVEHKDSFGNLGHIKGGDVQWMTAGSGVIHSEGATESFSKTGGVLHLIQLWINLPAAHKMMAPSYQDISLVWHIARWSAGIGPSWQSSLGIGLCTAFLAALDPGHVGPTAGARY